ncbi:hypothetical protein [Cellulophaga sp. Asnod2-G02]|uniref:hypothetical protein n=1 Tax=Cellulophaga sp. Asnod2-G02 TaxID=3160572 RepID=UPI00386B5C53
MATEIIKLRIRKESSTGENSQRILEKFIKACKALDCSIIEPLIDDDHYFEELDKYRFLASLREQFDWAIDRGAKTIEMKLGRCEMCVIGHPAYEFYGNESNPEFAYIINTKKGVILDIFLCNASSGRSK